MTKPVDIVRRRWLEIVLSAAAALAVGGILLGPSPSARARTETKPAGGAPLAREVVQKNYRRASNDGRTTTERKVTPVTVVTGNLAGTLSPAEPPGSDATLEAEPDRLRERLPGERLTLDHRARSLAAIERLLAGPLEGSERAGLERRKAVLEAKQGEQASRVARIEQRLSILERP